MTATMTVKVAALRWSAPGVALLLSSAVRILSMIESYCVYGLEVMVVDVFHVFAFWRCLSNISNEWVD
jgi:hypothetical protein